MKAKTKRTRSAWLLLSVFVSMMMLSALHRHETDPVVTPTCADCAHHVHHGHLTTGSVSMHECLLCQFISFSYVAATTLAIALPSASIMASLFRQTTFCCQQVGSYRFTRAPPYAFE